MYIFYGGKSGTENNKHSVLVFKSVCIVCGQTDRGTKTETDIQTETCAKLVRERRPEKKTGVERTGERDRQSQSHRETNGDRG